MLKILGNLLSCVRGGIKDQQVPGSVVAEVGHKEDTVVVDETETALDYMNTVAQGTAEGPIVNKNEEAGVRTGSVADPGVNTAAGGSSQGSDSHQGQSSSLGPNNSTNARKSVPVADQSGDRNRSYSTQLQGTSTRGNSAAMGGASSAVVNYPNISQGLIGASNVLMTTPLRENLQMAVTGEVSDLQRSLVRLHNQWENRCTQLLQQNQDRYERIYEEQVRQWEILVVYAPEDEMKGQRIRELIRTHHQIVTPDPFCEPGQNILDFYEKHLSSYICVILLVSKALLTDYKMKNFVISELICQENRNIYPLYLESDLDFPEGLNTISSFTRIEERHLTGRSDCFLKEKLLRFKKEIEKINNILRNR